MRHGRRGVPPWRRRGCSRRADIPLTDQAVALYAYLARTPSALIGVSLADAVGQRQPQNVPGTMNEYPNWRIPLADGEDKPVLLEDLGTHPGVQAIADAVGGRRAEAVGDRRPEP